MGLDLALDDPKVQEIAIVDEYINMVILGTPRPHKKLAEKFDIKPATIYGKIARNQRYISDQVTRYFKAAEIDKIAVLEEVRKLAFFNISDVANFDGYEMTYEDWSNLPKEVLACVKHVEITENEKTGVKRINVHFYDKQKALDQLTKILEIAADKVVKHEGEVTHTHRRLFDDVFNAPEAIPVEPQAIDSPAKSEDSVATIQQAETVSLDDTAPVNGVIEDEEY